MPRATGAATVPMKRRRERPVFVPLFGARLRELRGDQSLAEVCRAISSFGFALDHSTLFHYERGTVKAPDPALLFALAHHYGVDDLGALIGLLVKERLGRPTRQHVIGRSTFTRDQRRVAEWFGEFSDELQRTVLFVLSKLHTAEPPRPDEPVRRRRSAAS